MFSEDNVTAQVRYRPVEQSTDRDTDERKEPVRISVHCDDRISLQSIIYHTGSLN